MKSYYKNDVIIGRVLVLVFLRDGVRLINCFFFNGLLLREDVIFVDVFK